MSRRSRTSSSSLAARYSVSSPLSPSENVPFALARAKTLPRARVRAPWWLTDAP